MKKLHYFSLFLLLIFSCQKKFEYEYTFIAEIPPYDVEKVTLVLTNTDGKILGDIDIPKIGSEIRQTFTMQLKYPLETYDAHLIFKGAVFIIFQSHLGLNNSGSIVLDARSNSFSPIIAKNINFTVPNTVYRAAGVNSIFVPQSGDQTLLNIGLQENQGLFIENNKNSSTKRGVLYLKYKQVKDTILTDKDFKKVVRMFPIQKISDRININKLYAVSPDESEFVCLFEKVLLKDTIPIVIPENLDPSWRYYVSYNAKDFAFHRFYNQDTKFDIGQAKIEILSKEIKNDKVSIY